MNKKIILSILPISIIIFSTYSMLLTLQNNGTNPILLSSNSSYNPYSILSGYYTGINTLGGMAIVPETNFASLTNGAFVGGDIYVYGNISIKNSALYGNLFVLKNGNATLTNVTLKNSAQLFCYGNSSLCIENISREYNKYLSYQVPDLLTYDYSNVRMNNTIILSYSFGFSTLNITNMQNYTINGIPNYIYLYHKAQASIKDSYIDCIRLGSDTRRIDRDEPKAFLNSSSLTVLYSYGNSTTWMFNSSNINYLEARDYSIIYKDVSSNIGFPSLYDNATIIVI